MMCSHRKPLLFRAFRRHFVLLTVFFLWALPVGAAAPPGLSVPTSRPLSLHSSSNPFQQGVQFSRKAEWGKALERFSFAKQQMLLKMVKKQRAMLFLYMGLSYIHLLQRQRGLNAFEKALLLDACILLPKKLDLSPQIRSEFAKVQRPYKVACRRQRSRVAVRRVLPQPVRRRPSPRVLLRPKVLEPSKAIRLSAWVVLSIGVVTLGTGSVFGGLALWDELARNRQPLSGEGTVRYLELDRSARNRAAVANVLFGTSGVLLFTGFALHISQWIQPLLPKQNNRVRASATILLRE